MGTIALCIEQKHLSFATADSNKDGFHKCFVYVKFCKSPRSRDLRQTISQSLIRFLLKMINIQYSIAF